MKITKIIEHLNKLSNEELENAFIVIFPEEQIGTIDCDDMREDVINLFEEELSYDEDAYKKTLHYFFFDKLNSDD
ncbi:MAG: hypothetical protein ACOC1O_00380 [bacterium]